VSLAGCWPAPGAGPNRQANNPFETTITAANVAQLQLAWSAPTDSGPVDDPVVAGGTVHVRGGVALYGFDVGTGARRWKKDVDMPSIVESMGQPFVDGQQLLAGEGHGNLGGNYHTNRIDPATGAVLGQLPSPGGMVDAVRGSTYLLTRVGFGSGGPFALAVTIVDRNDPSRGWSGVIDITTSTGTSFGGPLTLGNDRAYQAGVGTLINGTTLTRGNGLRAYPVVAPPGCPSPITGAVCPAWSTPLDGTSSVPPVLDDAETTVFTGTSAGTVVALDAATGAVRWSTPLGSGVAASPALAGGRLYVPTAGGSLMVLDAATGAVQWSTAPGAGISGQPAVAGGVVYTGSSDGSLHGYAAAGCGTSTCPALWTATTGSAIDGAPAVSAGQVYAGTADGRLVAFRLP
jgi:outer membrane protein assembly factor BamB